MTVRIKSDHKLKGLSKYLVRDSHERPKTGRKLIDTYYYDVPEKRATEARMLGGKLCERNECQAPGEL